MLRIFKKLFSSATICFILFFSISPVYAQTTPTYTSTYYTIEPMENGGYLKTIIAEQNNLASTRATSSKTGSKTVEYYNAYDELC